MLLQVYDLLRVMKPWLPFRSKDEPLPLYESAELAFWSVRYEWQYKRAILRGMFGRWYSRFLSSHPLSSAGAFAFFLNDLPALSYELVEGWLELIFLLS
jgi:hypothetical protein